MQDPETKQKVRAVLNEIKTSKDADGNWSKKSRRQLFRELELLTNSDRNTYTGQDARFLTHTSMREFGEDHE